MDDEVYQKLEKLSHEMDVKKSHLLKHAFMHWAHQRDSTQGDNMMVIGKPVFKLMLDEVKPEKIREFGRVAGENMAGRIHMWLLQKNETVSLEKFIEMNNRVFVKGAMGWFDTISNKIFDDKTFQIYGMHSLNKKFSIFIAEMLNAVILDLFNLHLDGDRSEIRSNMINLIFIKME
jgi:hypothetical protein